MRRSKFQLGYEFTIPELPGVYVISKKLTDEILYVGKTTNLRRRFGRHLKKTHNFRFNKFMSQTTDELIFRYCIGI
ncbi:GIY-YIG nuclease family protein [Priestia megaterium]|uniref:GIY-YIG nuclease family protein n=1 Tax=Priestia megaterium TaxID=1404 RepID=UPI003AB867D3